MSEYGLDRVPLPWGTQGLRAEPEAQAESNHALLRSIGYTVECEWDVDGPQPLVWIGDVGDGKPVYIGHRGRGITDHVYRLTGRGATVYVTEPYDLILYPENLTRLSDVVKHGWEISLSALPLWYPGRTTPIWFRRTPPVDGL